MVVHRRVCDHKAKKNADLKIHLANKHDIGVRWHQCPHCDHKAKQKSDLKKHINNKHEEELLL